MTQQKYLALGGATGIGQQVCEKLMSSGHEVILMDRVAPEFDVTHYIQIDLTEQSAVDAALQQFAELGIKIDVLFNIAGLPPREGLTEKIIA